MWNFLFFRLFIIILIIFWQLMFHIRDAERKW